ncbi:alkyl-hydroperoxide reductase/thiol specific antioxidant family protein [Fictibacillus sp. BK138]|nr:alkyl-hydroperoxide reductase/thiol specific antioxidant family protein [Fictibacillus sp. BK138]
MRKSYEEFEARSVKVVIVSPADREQIEKFLEIHGPFPFNIYGDPKLNVYREMGNHRFTTLKSLAYVGAGILSGKAKISDIIPKEEKKRDLFFSAVKNQDVNVQGSSWLFDREGEILWKHMDDSPKDHARVREILKQASENK